MNDTSGPPPGAIPVTTDELLMLIGRLYLENYVAQRRLALLQQQVQHARATQAPEPSPPSSES